MNIQHGRGGRGGSELRTSVHLSRIYQANRIKPNQTNTNEKTLSNQSTNLSIYLSINQLTQLNPAQATRKDPRCLTFRYEQHEFEQRVSFSAVQYDDCHGSLLQNLSGAVSTVCVQ